MLHDTFKHLDGEQDLIFIENKIFNAVQIINQIIQDFEPKRNNLNFSCSFLKKYFKQRNVQGIFNRVEWKFSLRQGIKCELLTPDNNGKRQGKLEIKVIIEFSPLRKQAPSMVEKDTISDSLSIRDSKSSENCEIKVSLDFAPNEFEETPTSDKTKSALGNVYWMSVGEHK